MTLVEHIVELSGPGCYGRSARPEVVGAVLARIKPTIRETVRMGVLHSSRLTRRPYHELRSAWDIRFEGQTGGQENTTRLHFAAPRFSEAAPRLFERGLPWDEGPKPDDTAFDLVGAVLQDVAAGRRESQRFDAELLSRVAGYESAFRKGLDQIRFTGNQLDYAAAAVINRQVTQLARTLVQETPKPTRARVCGRLDMIRVSDRVFELVLDDGARVKAVWIQPAVAHLGEVLNQMVMIEGNAVFRPSGSLLRVDTEILTLADEKDRFFSTMPQPSMERLAIRRYLEPQTSKDGFNAIFGEWPGDETDEEIRAALEEIS